MKKYYLFVTAFFLLFVPALFADENESNQIVEKINQKLVRVPGGNFFMGSENQEENESPVHNVSLDSFSISKTEITQEEYFAVTGENLSYHKNPQYPVEEVSWYDAVVFCNKLSILSGLEPAYSLDGTSDPDLWGKIPRLDASKDEIDLWNKIEWDRSSNGYRLPTEAEWEYAARGALLDGGFAYSGFENLDDAGWWKDNSGQKTHECASLQPNGTGLYDMSGNVWEWCWDWYSRYPSEAQANPCGNGKSGSGRKVRKGGSFKSDGEFCRNTNRASTAPEIRGRDLGFRIAKSEKTTETFYLSGNDFEIDGISFPYSVVTGSYTDYQIAETQKNRLESAGVNAYVVKNYSDENQNFSFDVHVGYFASAGEASKIQSQLKERGIKNASVKHFGSSVEKYDSLVKMNSIAYDNGEENIPGTISESVRACLEMLPSGESFGIEYLELVDIDNFSGAGKNLESLMLEDFFADSYQDLHAAFYAEYEDSVFNKSLIVVAAKSDGGIFSDKQESFARSFMDGVYAEGSFGLETGGMKCTVVEPYGQFVLCGTNEDGSIYLLIFARGFSADEFKDFIADSYGRSSRELDAQLKKTLCVLPDKNENDSRDFLKFILCRAEGLGIEEMEPSDFYSGLERNFMASSSFVQNQKEISSAVYQLDYDYKASKKYNIYKAGIGGGKELVLQHGVPGVSYSSTEKDSLVFASRSYVVFVEAGAGNFDDIESFSNDMKVWK